MREYDPNLPLIAIHIPKTGGSSVKQLYKKWFKTGFLPHYKRRGKLPRKHDLSCKHSNKTPVVVYGHFNKLRGFGIEDYYPEAKQFVTILRNPFERAVSRYFFLKKTSKRQDELRNVLLHQIPEWSMFCHFPRDITMDNYKEIIETHFIEIGVMEHMEESIQRISKKLNRQYQPKSVKRRNVSKRDSSVPYELEEEFIEKHPLEYAVYNYVSSKYTKAPRQTQQRRAPLSLSLAQQLINEKKTLNQHPKVNFLVVGAQKSGTSTLNNYLRQHPGVEMAKRKELHFFDMDRNFDDKVDYEKYHRNFKGDGLKIRGESTPVYMFWQPAMKRIYEYNPDMKIIAVLRNPIERAFSHWNMVRNLKRDNEDFLFAIKNEEIRRREMLPLQRRKFSYIARGLYSDQIKRIWRYFPKPQTLFIRHEELIENPKKTMDQISEFLGVFAFKDLLHRNIRPGKYSSTLSMTDYKYLLKIFDNDIKQTEQMLNWNCFTWKYPEANKLLKWIKNFTFFKH